MSRILLADNQDITCAGLMFVCLQMHAEYKRVADKAELISQLAESSDAVVVLDYTLFDINDVDELLILSQRFTQTRWILFSEDLSVDFVRGLIASPYSISVVLKESPLTEVREAFSFALKGERYICQRMTETLLRYSHGQEERVKLTKTETEVLKDIALGLTTKEIAEKRFSSFHTINTHRKNIFRKLGVNNVHEATKYALRAGLVDSAEYYI